MSATFIDDAWFKVHPDRQYRLRRQTPAELAQWPVPPGPEFTGFCIIRKSDGAMALFALKAGEAWDDHDMELKPFFEELQEHAA